MNSPLIVEGRAWMFPESNINTDLIMPSAAFRLPLQEQVKLVFSANRPGWAGAVQPGDVIIGGRNFGTGSSRPAPQLLRLLGIRALVADSINDLFFRNCVNYGIPAMECPGASDSVQEGDIVRVDVVEGLLTNNRTGTTYRGPRMPQLLRDIVTAGGLYQRLKDEGCVE